MRFWLRTLLAASVVVGIAIAGLSYAYWDLTVQIGDGDKLCALFVGSRRDP